ncbi:MAG: hypothetical protein LQ337_005885 [Flavoplaca oasis]|nr:MAG: hypothetical protein LQ337_005885 [Flavoplaca oasis]
MDATSEQWLALHNYQDALNLNQAYIRGEIPGPLDAETGDLVPGLLRLHEYGLLTHSSQPFKPVQREHRNQNGGWWQEWRQRPYITFLAPQQDRIPKTAVEKFTLLLLMHPAIVTIVAYGKADRSYRTNINGDHIVTAYKLALSAEDLAKEDFKTETSVAAEYYHVFEKRDELHPVIRAQCLDITVASRSWDEDIDLAKLVEDLAIEAGIQRDYCEDLEPAGDSVSIEEQMAAAYNALCDESETEHE